MGSHRCLCPEGARDFSPGQRPGSGVAQHPTTPAPKGRHTPSRASPGVWCPGERTLGNNSFRGAGWCHGPGGVPFVRGTYEGRDACWGSFGVGLRCAHPNLHHAIARHPPGRLMGYGEKGLGRGASKERLHGRANRFPSARHWASRSGSFSTSFFPSSSRKHSSPIISPPRASMK